MPQQGRNRALVIGAGICGLTAARVLTDHFDEVVLVERNTLPEDDGHRSGVPQAHHVHGLLALGAEHLERLFPGLSGELGEGGAPVFDHGAGARTQVWAGTLPPLEAGVEVQTFHRAALEGAMRRRVTALPKVTVRDGNRVVALRVDKTNNRVDGLVLEGEDGQQEDLAGQLVVDASGRFSRLPDWLEQAGYPRPAETVVDGGLAYATRVVEVAERPEGIHGLQQMNQAPDKPGGVYAADIGEGRWIVTLFGAGGSHPPADEAGWQKYATELGNPHLDKLLDGATPVTEVRTFKQTRNQRRDYAKMTRRPDRLVALGDSFCSFNPVFGQGMTVAVLQAAALGEELGEGGDLSGLSGRFQRRIARDVRNPWLMATSEDGMWSHAMRGTRPPLPLRVTAWYKQRLLHLAVHERDPHVLRTFMRVYHMLTAPTAMGGPRILAKVLTRARSPRASSSPIGAAKSPAGSGG